jgi:putative polymerase
MTNAYALADYREAEPAARDPAVEAVLYACLLENPVLALINNWVHAINAGTITAVQLVLTLAAVALVMARRPQAGWALAAGFAAFAFFALIKIVYTGNLNQRFVYDVSMIPLFLLLGASTRAFNPRFFTTVLLIVLAGTLFELFAPLTYADVFNPRKYFYFTRDWVAADIAPDASIYNTAGIYIGSVRESGSFFGMLHRVGSIFLEPISLGYFAVVASVVFMHAPGLSWRYRAVTGFVCLFLAIASDTRVSVFLVLAVLFGHRLFAKIPRPALVAAPFVLLMCIFAAYPFARTMHGDIGLRLAITVDQLTRSSLADIVFGGVDASQAYDSGIVYMISNAGLGGFLVYPLLASGVLLPERRSASAGASILLYLLIALVFSCAPMSIKTASLLGYGVAAPGGDPAEDEEDERPSLKDVLRRWFRRSS